MATFADLASLALGTATRFLAVVEHGAADVLSPGFPEGFFVMALLSSSLTAT